MIEDARTAALSGRWHEAININQRIIERSPKDAEAHNRMGRAYLALGRYTEAIDAYTAALRADPANLIARRNLQRLDILRHRGDATPDDAQPDPVVDESVTPNTTMFVEEVGKTWVDELVNPPDPEVLVDVYPAEQLDLVVDGNRLVVQTKDGRRLGEIEAKTADHIIQLMAGGNRYEAYSLGLSAHSLRVILRETFHDPSLAEKISFPRQITSRAYLRERDLLRQRDESDFFFSDDDEEDDEAPTPDADDDDSSDTDGEPFIEESVSVSDDEEQNI
jgi:tetratricopeptide (TPR) repeat protein